MQMVLLYIDLEKERKGGKNGTLFFLILFFSLSSSFTRNNCNCKTLPIKKSGFCFGKCNLNLGGKITFECEFTLVILPFRLIENEGKI